MGTRNRRRHPGRIVIGMIVIVVGMSLLADRVTDTDLRFTSHMWPLIVIAIGAARFLYRPLGCDGLPRDRPGVWLIYLGIWGLTNEYRLLGFDYATSWPLLVIGAGLMIVWHALDPRRTLSPPRDTTGLGPVASPSEGGPQVAPPDQQSLDRDDPQPQEHRS